MRALFLAIQLALAISALALPITPLEYGLFYGYPTDYSQCGLLMMNPHNPIFSLMPPESIKAPHGHFQHFAPGRPDDDFPFQALKDLEAQEVAAGRSPIFVTATYQGKSRPVYLSWHLGLNAQGIPTAPQSWWSQAVNLRSDAFIQFFADQYVHGRMFAAGVPNYWLEADNCSFWVQMYGVLDDNGVYHAVSKFDPPFAQSDPDYLDSIVYFLKRLKEIAPDIHIMGNEGTISNESRFSEVFSGFDGTCREDCLLGFKADAASRNSVYSSFCRAQWEGPAGKLSILRFPLSPDPALYPDQFRTAYMAYLIFRGPNFFFGPLLIGTNNGAPPADVMALQGALGTPRGEAVSQSYSSTQSGYRLYWRYTAHGIVYLNWSGQAVSIPLPSDHIYLDRNYNQVTTLVIPDLTGDYVLCRQ